MVKVKEDITGWKMWEHGIPESRLTVVRQVDDYVCNGVHYAQYLCECNCGNNVPVFGLLSAIKTGRKTSCGCIKKEKISDAQKEYNDYKLDGEYGIGYCHNTGTEFYFDIEDYDLIKDYCWLEHISTKDNYRSLEAKDTTSNEIVRMHWLFGCKGYDHEDRNPLNNRRNNLRPATQQENACNASVRKDNTSGVIGVGWNKRAMKWRARITYNGELIQIGSFINKEEAIKARLEAEVKYRGKFAPQKHLFEEYGITTDL